jgi:5-methylcytosine-specific restriction protein B
MTDSFELDAQRVKFALVTHTLQADTERAEAVVESASRHEQARSTGLAILDGFLAGGELEAFRLDLIRWGHEPGGGLGGQARQIFWAQLLTKGEADETAEVLRAVLASPLTDVEAAEQIDRLGSYCDKIRSGSQPAPGHAPFVCSFFWALREQDRWPVIRSDSFEVLTRVGWLVPTEALGADYLAFADIVRRLGRPAKVVPTLGWWNEHPFVGLDPSLIERIERSAVADARSYEAGTYTSETDRAFVERQARIVLGELKLIGPALEDRVANALQRSVKFEFPRPKWDASRFRLDGWVSWSTTTVRGKPAMRLWITGDGVFAGLHPGSGEEGWYLKAAEAVAPLVSGELAMFPVRYHNKARVDTRPVPSHSGEFVVGRWYADGLGRADLTEDLVALAASLQPLLDRLVDVAVGAPPKMTDAGPDPLRAKVDHFRKTYPSERDLQNRGKREEMAGRLAHQELPVADIAEIRWMWNSNAYGSPGPQSRLNAAVRDATPKAQQDFLRSLDYLLWSEDADEARINRLLDPDDLGTPGLGEAVIVKLLSLSHPERWLPIFPYVGQNGKKFHLPMLGLDSPDPTLSRGALQVRSNDLIRGRLDRFFPNDPWGAAQFVFWFATHPDDGADPVNEVALLANELLIDASALEELVGLLEDKGQIILYGPPGTGKTYLARRLGAVLAGDPDRCAIVQFHPSMSYEDFFEGYRPRLSADGQLAYELQQGPLAMLAEQAQAAPSVRHVLVIDEINRANLPRVFGELLFLLEYRDEEVRTTYRPDAPFSLPPNLWFIGTMNTADRSVALIDAALRRRFHFVPFFPEDGMIAGLLGRWLHEHAPDAAWIAQLVSMVNGELTVDLGGPHLQLGPSHFMRTGIDEARLASIWRYNIIPFIEDQLFGEPAKMAKYRFEAVLDRFRRLADEASGPADDIE